MDADKQRRIAQKIENNIDLIDKIISTFKLNINPKLMSNILREDNYIKNFEQITDLYRRNKSSKELFMKTILKNRLKQEEATDFLYSREEVAIILSYDYKVGPPREKFYDQVALKYKRYKNETFGGIYVKPTYPLGVNFDFFITNPEIEKYGLTPYKSGSNKLQSNRIILQNSHNQTINKLIENSYHSNEVSLPNPLLDLYIIADLAKRIVTSDYDFPVYNFSNFDVGNILPSLNKYIFSKL